jgi:hypothetical protein
MQDAAVLFTNVVVDEFSEVHGSLRTLVSPARFKGKLVGFVARDRYEQWRLATHQLPENSSEERHLPSPDGGWPVFPARAPLFAMEAHPAVHTA